MSAAVRVAAGATDVREHDGRLTSETLSLLGVQQSLTGRAPVK